MRVAVAPNEPIAGLWRSVLDEAGIVSMIRPLGPGFGAWGSVATFEHEVLVPEADLDDARALVDKTLATIPAPADGLAVRSNRYRKALAAVVAPPEAASR